jgi:CBS domain-containing protein
MGQMREIESFLAAHSPFDTLPAEVLAQTAATVQVRRYERGTRIIPQGGPPAAHLYVLARGLVELRQHDDASVGGAGELIHTLSEGSVFGQLSVLGRAAPLFDAVASKRSLCYLIPAEQLERLRLLSGFEALLIQRAGDYIRQALATRRAAAAGSPFTGRARELIARPLVTCAPDETVRDAAKRMHAEGVSSLVVDGDPPGFLSDRDLRDRVLAPGLDPHTLVSGVMTTPLITATADATVTEMLLTMVERGIHHLPISEAGLLTGMVTDTDLLRHESRHPLFLRRRLDHPGPANLVAYAEEVRLAAIRLIDAATPVDDLGRITGSAWDGLVTRVLRDAEARLGPPPGPYAFLVLGSQARLEATLHSDQDHALVLADDAGAEAEAYATALAEEVITVLERCGLPRCPGGIMASNPRWRLPLQAWRRAFRTWISEPDEEALADAIIFFDFRQVHGSLDAESALRPLVQSAADHPVFLASLARTALRRESPLDFMGQLRGVRRGEHRHQLDLKLHGIAAIVDLARVFALEAGLPEANTLARLRLANGRSAIESVTSDLAEAFEYLQEVRLRHQAAQLRAEQVPDNYVGLSDLSPLEHRWLKDLFRLIQISQESVRVHLQARAVD